MKSDQDNRSCIINFFPVVIARRAAHASEGAMKVKVISILEDNYMYLVIEEHSKQALAVDPAVPHRVRRAFPVCPVKFDLLGVLKS